jgi:hypothetical protein
VRGLCGISVADSLNGNIECHCVARRKFSIEVYAHFKLFRHIFYRQQDQLRIAGAVNAASCVEQNLVPTDAGKIMLHFIALETLVVRKDDFQ